MSHTQELIEEALDKLEKYLDEKHLTADLEAAQYSTDVKRTGINRYFGKLGIQVVRVREWQNAQKFGANYFGKLSSVQFFNFASQNAKKFDEIYNLLVDEASRTAFDWYIRYRTAYAFIGEAAYELFTPEITREAWYNLEKRIRRTANNFYKVDEFTIEATTAELIGTYIVQQYRYKSVVAPKLGDIVFDIGAYVGDTALWLSKAVGPQGKVYSFEPEPRNFEKLKANLERNRVTNVFPLQLAVSETEGEMQVASGAGSSVITQVGIGSSVKVTTIDKFVEANKLPRVDYIKMDVEGHELSALKGAIETIRTFKPSLALSAYHRGDDVVALPKILLELNPDYKFYLKHCSYSWAETVLYAGWLDI